MKKTILALLCAAALMLGLCACESEHKSEKSVTVSSSTTDENGVTTTTTTTTTETSVSAGGEGVKTESHTTTETVTETPAPDAEPEAPGDEGSFDDWAARFSGGAIGENAEGDQFLFAWDDPDDICYAALMIISADGSEGMGREGAVTLAGADDNVYYLLTDSVKADEIAFNIYPSAEGDFDLFFRGDADTAVMNEVDYETIIGAFAQVLGVRA